VPEALATLDRARAAFDAALGADSPEGAGVLFLSGRLWLGLGEARAAADDLERALEVRTRSHGDAHPESAELRSWLGLALARAGESERGLEAARAALALGQQHLASSDAALGELCSHVAGCYRTTGAVEDEVRYRTLALESHERVEGPDSDRTGVARARLLAALRRAGTGEREEELLAALRAAAGPATRLALAELLVEGAAAEQAEGRELLERLAEEGSRPAMSRLADLLEVEGAEAEALARAARLRDDACSLDDPDHSGDSDDPGDSDRGDR
jgi:hypothetical protein